MTRVNIGSHGSIEMSDKVERRENGQGTDGNYIGSRSHKCVAVDLDDKEGFGECCRSFNSGNGQ